MLQKSGDAAPLLNLGVLYDASLSRDPANPNTPADKDRELGALSRTLAIVTNLCTHAELEVLKAVVNGWRAAIDGSAVKAGSLREAARSFSRNCRLLS